jgi:hypothetical protein
MSETPIILKFIFVIVGPTCLLLYITYIEGLIIISVGDGITVRTNRHIIRNTEHTDLDLL